MKSIRAGLFLAAAVLAFLPFYGGYAAQRAYVGLIDGMRLGGRGQLRVESEFHRGWLRSRAVTRLRGVGSGDPLEITLHHRFTHGPVPFGELLQGRLPGVPVLALVDTTYTPRFAQASPWREALAGRPLLTLHTTARTAGSIETEFHSPALDHRSERGEIVWAGIRGSLRATRDFSETSGLIEIPRFELRADGEALRMKRARIEFENATTANDLPEGALSLSVSEFSAAGGADAGGELAVHNWGLWQTAEEDLAFGSYEVSLGSRFDALELDGERYGPGEFEIVLRNLPASALHELGEQLEAVAERHEGNGEERFAQLNAGLDVLPKLLALSPEIVLTRLQLRSDAGELSGTARVGIDGEKARAMPGALFLLMAVEADASFFVPRAMFESLVEAYLMAALANEGPIPSAQSRRDLKRQLARSRGQVIGSFLEAGTLVQEGNGYRARLKFRDGQLWLNGRLHELNGRPAARAVSLQGW